MLTIASSYILQEVCTISNMKMCFQAGACAGFLKGVGEVLARIAGSEVAGSEAICGNGPGAQPPEKFLTEFYAKQIGYQYRRFKAVDNTL